MVLELVMPKATAEIGGLEGLALGFLPKTQISTSLFLFCFVFFPFSGL